MEKTWLACQPVGNWDDFPVEFSYAYRILCFFANAKAYGYLE